MMASKSDSKRRDPMNTQVMRPGHMLPHWERDAYEALEPCEQASSLTCYTAKAKARIRASNDLSLDAEARSRRMLDVLMGFCLGAASFFAAIYAAALILGG